MSIIEEAFSAIQEENYQARVDGVDIICLDSREYQEYLNCLWFSLGPSLAIIDITKQMLSGNTFTYNGVEYTKIIEA